MSGMVECQMTTLESVLFLCIYTVSGDQPQVIRLSCLAEPLDFGDLIPTTALILFFKLDDSMCPRTTGSSLHIFSR